MFCTFFHIFFSRFFLCFGFNYSCNNENTSSRAFSKLALTHSPHRDERSDTWWIFFPLYVYTNFGEFFCVFQIFIRFMHRKVSHVRKLMLLRGLFVLPQQPQRDVTEFSFGFRESCCGLNRLPPFAERDNKFLPLFHIFFCCRILTVLVNN